MIQYARQYIFYANTLHTMASSVYIEMTTCQCYSYSSIEGFIFRGVDISHLYGDREKNDMHRGGGLCTVQTTCNAGAGNKRESTV